MEASGYITPTEDTKRTSLIYQIEDSEGKNVIVDPMKRAVRDPSNLKAMAPLTNDLILMELDRQGKIYKDANVITMDSMEQHIAFKIINYNYDKLF